MLASLGCGNPTVLAQLEPGEVVLDLGSGGGIDVLLSARRVGPTGKAYGLDMTDDMLALARENQRQAGVENVEFLKGEIEAIPLPDDAVDVIISNCVINLSADKRRVLAEAFRVLRAGRALRRLGRGGPRRDAGGRCGATSSSGSAASPARWRRRSTGACSPRPASRQIEIEPTRIYRAEDARALLSEDGGIGRRPGAAEVDGKVMSAFVRARKPRRRRT